MRSPVTQAEWSEAMKTATHAMSSGSPSRPIGKLARMLLAVSPSMPTTAKPSVGRAELAHYPAVIYAQGGGSTTWRFRKGANEETDTQNVSLHITAAEGVRAAVFADLGLCFASGCSSLILWSGADSGRVRQVMRIGACPTCGLPSRQVVAQVQNRARLRPLSRISLGAGG
jgi:LysR substrate binding domain